MALVNIINVAVLDNPSSFTNPLQFEITFECLQELPDDLEWKVIYVGNAEDSTGDQTLEEVMVGPVSIGINRFVLQANPPNPALIRNDDLIGVTVILITCSLMDANFVQIGYYVGNEYTEAYDPETPPNPVDITKLARNIRANDPRVTRFAIDWGGGNSLPLPEAVEGGDDDEENALETDGDDDDEEEEEDDEEENALETDGDDDDEEEEEDDEEENALE
eukprot:CAMPEP_0173296064 /NCGR_PEP_ID=MMETSP1143-20121109/14750_1 /TAXON_ID=483371 /ORGANISM="non described non described, Strain CCMP2298" /LENGTH=219 /DNA_ID=CAMNT_0014235869 /DNA_START=73 /DNA_END=729 /DNA_ORIENTATION=-